MELYRVNLLNSSIFIHFMDTIPEEKLKKYFSMSKGALLIARKAECEKGFEKTRVEFLDTISRYISDAEHFNKKNDKVNAFAALNYAHGWLDAGAKLGLWKVSNSRLFAGVD